MQRNRRLVQLAFLALVVGGVFVVRGNAERWCPFGGVEAAFEYLREGSMLCSLGVSNFYILGAVLVSVLLLRRAFCSHACPIGTVSELVRDLGARTVRRKPVRVPPRVDRLLGLVKYAVLALILWFTWRTAELVFRGYDLCYALIGRHGEDITVWAYVVSGVTLAASLYFTLPFCRWLCPFAAVLAPFSRFGLAGVRRHGDTCTDCGKCSLACPMGIDVASAERVTEARCTSCLSCVASCPGKKGPALSWGPGGAGRPAWSQGALVASFLVVLASGVLASELWPVPSFVRERGVAGAPTGSVELSVDQLSCRGRGALLWYYLDRDDLFALPGPLRVEAWPGPGFSRVRVRFDPERVDEEAVQLALTEPYYDTVEARWRPSPFSIEGYDPLGLDELLDD